MNTHRRRIWIAGTGVMAAGVLSPAFHVDLDKVYVAAWKL